MESSWRPPTSSTKRPRRRAVSAAARGRARCCRSRKSAATARNGTGRPRMSGERLPEWRDDFLGERVERVPVVGAVAESDVDAGAAGVAEGGDHLPGLRRGAPQPARALAALGAPVLPKDLLSAQSPLGVRAQVEAEVDGPQDGLRVAPLLLAPLVQHLALRDPLLGADVGRVPAVGVARGRSERPLLAPAADPDGHAWLERLRIVRRVLEPEVRTVEVHAASLRVEEQAHALRVFLQHVITDPDARELVAEGPGLDLVPAGAEAAVDAAAGEMVDRGERLRVEPGIPVGDAVDEGPEPDALRVHGGRRQRGDRLVADEIAAAGRRLLEVVGNGEPVEAHRVGEAPERSEEHTSELQSPCNLVCRLLLEKKKKKNKYANNHRQTHL